MARLLVSALVATLALGIAGTASAATATWDGYNISTQDSAVVGGGIKAFAANLNGPNPLHSDRTLNFRVVRNTGGVLTYSTETPVPAGPGSGLPTSPPGVGANAFPIGFPCNTTTLTTYVPQVRVVNTANGGGSGWVSGPGVNLACCT